ncbi:MAG TPA: OmpH family outer membrane protein [Candidatus Angelobacter sp.]|nr:OmpH family outer membrane protein [Candidatus Angelobacter sp.]
MPVTSKTKILALSLGLSIAVSSPALAQGSAAAPAPAASGPAKVGIVNIQEAIYSTNEGKKEFDALQTKFGPKQTELKSLNDEVEGLKKSFEAQREKLSPEASATQARTIEAKQKLLQRNYDDYQGEAQQAEQEVMNKIGGKMLNVLEKYAKANGYSVILDVSNPQTPVLWASQGTIITKELVDAYNAESGVAAPAPKPAGATTNPPRPNPPRPTATPTGTPKNK